MPRSPRYCPVDWPVPPEILRQLIDYNPETGAMTWRARSEEFFRPGGRRDAKGNAACWNAKNAGKPALASVMNGYLCGRLFDRSVRAHRVAWAIHYGEWPSQSIDHINRNRTDNRIANLRDVPIAENNRNGSIRRNNTSGVTGVSIERRTGKWLAYVAGKRIGAFLEKADAIAARELAAAAHNFHPNHGRAI